MPPTKVKVVMGRSTNNKSRKRNGGSRRSSGLIGASDVPGLVNTPFSVMGTRRTALLRYNDSQSVSGTFTVGSAIWGLNCLYDPNITSTGNQPIGFDQLMVFFEHYTVTSCRVKMVFQNQTAGANAQVFAAVRGDVTPITDFYRTSELGGTSSLILQPFGVNGSIGVLEKTVSIGNYIGVKNPLNEFELRGTIAANPSEGVYLHTIVGNPAGVSTVTVLVYVTMEFKAVFTEPRDLTRSMKELRFNPDEEKRPSPTTTDSVCCTQCNCCAKPKEEVATAKISHTTLR